MKYFKIILLLLSIISLTACDDADDKVSRTSNSVVVHKGTRFILLSKTYEPLDTLLVEQTRTLTGTTTIQQNADNVGYSINGLGYRFNTFNAFDNIYFNFEGNKLVWIGSRSINSSFYFDTLTINKFDTKNIELEFAGEKDSIRFGINNNYYNMLIEGKISFNEKSK